MVIQALMEHLETIKELFDVGPLGTGGAELSNGILGEDLVHQLPGMGVQHHTVKVDDLGDFREVRGKLRFLFQFRAHV